MMSTFADQRPSNHSRPQLAGVIVAGLLYCLASIAIADDCGPHYYYSESGGCCPTYGDGSCGGYEWHLTQVCEGACPTGNSCKAGEYIYPVLLGEILTCEGACAPMNFCEIDVRYKIWGFGLIECQCSPDV